MRENSFAKPLAPNPEPHKENMTHAIIHAPNGERIAVRGEVCHDGLDYMVHDIQCASAYRPRKWGMLRIDWYTYAETALLAAWGAQWHA